MKHWKAAFAGAVLTLGLTGCVYYPSGEPDRYTYEPAYAPVYIAPSASFYYSSGNRRYDRDRGHYRGYGGYYHRRWH